MFAINRRKGNMKINEIIPKNMLEKLSKYLAHCYPVRAKRIYSLILQVNSIDVTLELLNYHSRSEITLDSIVMYYLTGRDNAESKIEFDQKFNKDKYVRWYTNTKK